MAVITERTLNSHFGWPIQELFSIVQPAQVHRALQVRLAFSVGREDRIG